MRKSDILRLIETGKHVAYHHGTCLRRGVVAGQAERKRRGKTQPGWLVMSLSSEGEPELHPDGSGVERVVSSRDIVRLWSEHLLLAEAQNRAREETSEQKRADWEHNQRILDELHNELVRLEFSCSTPGSLLGQADVEFFSHFSGSRIQERSGARGAHWVDTMNKPEVLPKVDVAFVMDWCDEMEAQKMREVGAEVIMVNSSDANSLRSAWLRSRLST